MEPLDKGKKRKLGSSRKAEKQFESNTSSTFDFTNKYKLGKREFPIKTKTDTTGLSQGAKKFPYETTYPTGRVEYGYATKDQVEKSMKKHQNKKSNQSIPNLPNYKNK